MLSILLFKLACFSGNVFKCDYVTIIEMITVFVSDNTFLKKSLIVVYSFTSCFQSSFRISSSTRYIKITAHFLVILRLLTNSLS